MKIRNDDKSKIDDKKVENKTDQPVARVYYGLHMVEGVAEYRDPEKGMYRLLINEKTIKNMDATFQGRPVYVKHVTEEKLQNLDEADGYVVRSFFNQADGKHWCEFLVKTNRGHEAIKKGWRLSNAYNVLEKSNGGQWHGVDYLHEVTKGEYEHLAILPNPRYEESVILTPEQFKTYNEAKLTELKRISNSKSEGRKKSMFNFFEKKKVENADGFDDMTVVLPESKKEVTVKELVRRVDRIENLNGYADTEHMVKVGDEEMSVAQLIKAFLKLKAAGEESSEGSEDESTKNKKKNADDDDKDKKKKDDDDEKKENRKKNSKDGGDEDEEEDDDKKKRYESLKNENHRGESSGKAVPLRLSHEQVALGKKRYGSK